jgi:protein-tyrosine phosphatase
MGLWFLYHVSWLTDRFIFVVWRRCRFTRQLWCLACIDCHGYVFFHWFCACTSLACVDMAQLWTECTIKRLREEAFVALIVFALALPCGKVSGLFYILVVCTANICRSPIGQALLKHELAGRQVVVHSAGTDADFGSQADPAMVELAVARNMPSLNVHRAQPVLPTMLRKYDLVLCMEPHHLERVLELDPTRVGRVKLLGHWGQGPIADPYRGSSEEYVQALGGIEAGAKAWANKLVFLGLVN